MKQGSKRLKADFDVRAEYRNFSPLRNLDATKLKWGSTKCTNTLAKGFNQSCGRGIGALFQKRPYITMTTGRYPRRYPCHCEFVLVRACLNFCV